MFFFGPVGGGIILVGFLMDIYLTWLWLAKGTQMRPIFILSLVFIVIGLFVFMVGFLAEIIVGQQEKVESISNKVNKNQ